MIFGSSAMGAPKSDGPSDVTADVSRGLPVGPGWTRWNCPLPDGSSGTVGVMAAPTLENLLDPAHTAVVTSEVQYGVVGSGFALPGFDAVDIPIIDRIA